MRIIDWHTGEVDQAAYARMVERAGRNVADDILMIEREQYAQIAAEQAMSPLDREIAEAERALEGLQHHNFMLSDGSAIEQRRALESRLDGLRKQRALQTTANDLSNALSAIGRAAQ